MVGAGGGRSSWRERDWLALRMIVRCESPWIRFVAQLGTLDIMPGDAGLQSHEEDVLGWIAFVVVMHIQNINDCFDAARNMRNMVCVGTELAKRPSLGRGWRLLCGCFLALRMLSFQVS